MPSPVTEHYANHLAPIYSWMVGDFDAACSMADAFYTKIGLSAGGGRVAIDLGCGHGVHAIPLARRGFRVIALDTSTQLLGELASVAGGLPIQLHAADMMEFKAILDGPTASLIACMGDTLTHLPSVDAVDLLIHDIGQSLAIDGLFAISFRDYSNHELFESARFIPVRSDDKRIHICFLDYRAETVLVHDIIHSWEESSWRTSVSAYPKLRLHPERFINMTESHGLALIHRSTDRGMLHLVFNRSQSSAA